MKKLSLACYSLSATFNIFRGGGACMLMEFTMDTLAKLAAPVITGAFGLFAKLYSDTKPRLVFYLVHAFAIPTRNKFDPEALPITVHTHSIVVRNSGKKTAHNIRLGHQSLPDFQIHPALIHETNRQADNSGEILIPTLVPGEQVTIGYLYFPPQTFQQVNTYCKSDEMSAKFLNVTPMVPFTPIQMFAFWSLVFIGASSLMYWIIYLLLTWGKN